MLVKKGEKVVRLYTLCHKVIHPSQFTLITQSKVQSVLMILTKVFSLLLSVHITLHMLQIRTPTNLICDEVNQRRREF